jgi:hypothetical protein
MNAETLTALRASIAKWERNAEAKKPAVYKIGEADCPLCALFIYPDRCEGCPVFEKVGERFCRGTPYIAASATRVTWNEHPSSEYFRDCAHAVARDEVAFLKSLLPEAEGTQP